MNELYWITRLDSINNCLTAIAVVATLLFGVCVIGWIYNTCQVSSYTKKNKIYNYEEDIHEYKAYLHTFTKMLKISMMFILFSYVGLMFIPSTKEMYLICGLGGTIDYIKSNDKAKQLPDKCIDTLDKYIESLNKEKDK